LSGERDAALGRDALVVRSSAPTPLDGRARYSLKEVSARRAVILPAAHAAVLESGGSSRTGMDRYGRASLRALYGRGQSGGLAWPSPRRGSPCGACWFAQKRSSASKSTGLRMVNLHVSESVSV